MKPRSAVTGLPGLEKPGSSPDFPLLAPTRTAGPSRLAFRLPAGTNALPYSLPDLLDWVRLEQSVVPVAQTPDINQPGVPEPPPIIPAPVIREPQVTETAIEAPWRLFLSPNYSRAWAHSATPVTLDNRTELWHARLAVRRRRPMGSQRTRRSRAGCAPSGRPITAREPSRLIRRSLR